MTSRLLRVAEVEPLTSQITRFRFEDPDGAQLPLFSGGAHVVVEMPDGDVLRRNAYSLISDPMDGSGYEIAVRRDDAGRGGSRYMHTHVHPGNTMRIGAPVNLFSLDLRARKHLLIGGGIGITPFVSQAKQLSRLQLPFELFYSVRNWHEAAGMKLLPKLPQVHIQVTDDDGFLDLQGILRGQPIGTHVYVCGPQPMIDAVYNTAKALGWPKDALHSEVFLAPPPGESFQVTLARSGITITVNPHQSLLEAIEAAGVDAPWLCRGGACGQCETDVISCKGEMQHNDHWLTDEDKAAQSKIMPCVSRFRGQELIIDR